MKEDIHNWRQNWFVKNILAKILVVGSFFKHDTPAARIHAAGECAAMVLGGVGLMLYSMPAATDSCNPEQIDSMKAPMVAGMLGGMMVGPMAYNTVYSGCAMLYGYVHSRARSESSATVQERLSLTSEVSSRAQPGVRMP